MAIRPPRAAVQAFGGAGIAVPLAGGRGNVWRVGELVLRPADDGDPPLAWQAEVLGSLACDTFRVSLPRRSVGGDFVHEGWCAWQFLEGVHDERRWPEIIAVGELFHQALAGAAEPAFLARRTDHWAIGDRVAWGELPAAPFMHVEHLANLLGVRRPLDSPRQLVHARLMDDPDPDLRDKAAAAWLAWEDAVVSQEPQGTPNAYSHRPPAAQLAFVRICAHYYANYAWLADGALLRDADRLAGIPAVLLHGRLDLGAPLTTAWELARAWPDAKLTVVADSGHTGSETMRLEIVRALDRFARS